MLRLKIRESLVFTTDNKVFKQKLEDLVLGQLQHFLVGVVIDSIVVVCQISLSFRSLQMFFDVRHRDQHSDIESEITKTHLKFLLRNVFLP